MCTSLTRYVNHLKVDYRVKLVHIYINKINRSEEKENLEMKRTEAL